MPCLRTPSTSSIAERVGADPADLLEVRAASTPTAPASGRPLFTSVPRALSTRSPTSNGLRGADGVVDDVDAAGPARPAGRPTAGAARRPTTPASSSTSSSRGSGANDRGAERAGQRAPGPAKRATDGDLDVGVQRAQDRGGAGAERAGAVDEHPAARRRRVAGDGVERHRERVGEHGDLVGRRVGHREQHRRGRASARRSRRWRPSSAGVDAGGEVAVVEAPAQAEVARLRRPGTAGRCPAARTTATG